jgi:hypothetical protein
MESTSEADDSKSETVEAGASGHLVRLVDIFFALVLGQGVLLYEPVVKDPLHANAAVLLALATIYFTVIRSFIAWHLAMEQRRYRILADGNDAGELARVFIDVIIVGVYAYLLLVARPLTTHADANLTNFLFGFFVLFVLYCVWGVLRRLAWGSDQYKLKVLAIFGGLYLGLWLWYRLDRGLFSHATSNLVALGVALGLMIVYRHFNWGQGRTSSAGAR